ncbi:hypothetical protein GGF46_003603 [Coemansia sp. RSA 552]|nr:hypothetical protein GGF46_003603 [Coemansia sp. RSA 552]
MWLRNLVDGGEKLALDIHHSLRLPGILLVILLSLWESVYCLLRRFFSSETGSEEKINGYIRAHQEQRTAQGRASETKVAIVTGANGGIGLETAKALGRAGFTTVLACRNIKRGQQARALLEAATGLKQTFVVMGLDLASFTSIEQFASEFLEAYSELNLLVCNAGVAFGHYDTTYDGLEAQFGTNFVGHYVLVSRLLPTLKATPGARITFASSIAACMVRSLDYSRVTDVWRFSRFVNYSTSKLALLVYAQALARKLRGSGITVNAFHPGLVATGLYRNVLLSTLPGIHDLRSWLWLDQVAGSVTSIYLALSPELDGCSGGFYAREQLTIMHPDALDQTAQDRLCKFTDVLVASNTHAPNLLKSINVP